MMAPLPELRWRNLSHFTFPHVSRLVAGLALFGLNFAVGFQARAADHGGLFRGEPPDPARSKRYYLAAEPTLWDYAPSGRDEVCGTVLPPTFAREHRAAKLRYFQYTDATFATRVVETPSLGILGPVLRGVVGDFLVVTFLNRTGQPLSLHPHGVKYDKDSEGANYGPLAGKGASVAPGETFTYVWQLDESAGPRPDEPSSKGWLYHSHVSGDDEINEGLIGVILVTDPARARPDGTPRDVDRELATLFLIFDESGLGAEAREAYEYVNNGSGIPARSWADIQETLEIGSRAAINGRTYGNLPGLAINEGERVRWYLFGLGSERDFHTAHWHGQRVLEEGRRRTDVIELLPASMKVADLLADNPGEWLFHCHVADHMREGMFARLTVHSREVVGASREPEHAFLGLAGAGPRASLEFTRAEATPPGSAGAVPGIAPNPPATHLLLVGRATVYEAYSVFRQTLTFRIGDAETVFSPGPDGTAKTNGPTGGGLSITNAGLNGVIYGGLLDFTVTLDGPAWSAALAKLAWSDDDEASHHRPIPITLTLGAARHETTTLVKPARP